MYSDLLFVVLIHKLIGNETIDNKLYDVVGVGYIQFAGIISILLLLFHTDNSCEFQQN